MQHTDTAQSQSPPVQHKSALDHRAASSGQRGLDARPGTAIDGVGESMRKWDILMSTSLYIVPANRRSPVRIHHHHAAALAAAGGICSVHLKRAQHRFSGATSVLPAGPNQHPISIRSASVPSRVYPTARRGGCSAENYAQKWSKKDVEAGVAANEAAGLINGRWCVVVERVVVGYRGGWLVRRIEALRSVPERAGPGRAHLLLRRPRGLVRRLLRQ